MENYRMRLTSSDELFRSLHFSKRMEARRMADEHEKQGRAKDAYSMLAKSVDVTPFMAYQVIQVLKTRDIEYLVAPYEADSQLAYLTMISYVDAVMTQDSDLIAQGCKHVLFKYEEKSGYAELYNKDAVLCPGGEFSGVSENAFLDICILAGCDYVASWSGVAFKKAEGYVRTYGSIEKAIEGVRRRKQHEVPDEYEQRVMEAKVTFLHQLVFDPISLRLVTKTPFGPGQSIEMYPFLGGLWPEDIAVGVCRGQLDPNTFQPFEELTTALGVGRLALSEPSSTRARPEPANRSILPFFQAATKSPTTQKRRESLTWNSLAQSPSKQTKAISADEQASGDFLSIYVKDQSEIPPAQIVVSKYFTQSSPMTLDRALSSPTTQAAAIKSVAEDLESPEIQAQAQEDIQIRVEAKENSPSGNVKSSPPNSQGPSKSPPWMSAGQTKSKIIYPFVATKQSTKTLPFVTSKANSFDFNSFRNPSRSPKPSCSASPSQAPFTSEKSVAASEQATDNGSPPRSSPHARTSSTPPAKVVDDIEEISDSSDEM
eukprot:TRINITY_DN2528_c0_g1_i13.p1 TRINITY_DN2528_c0_g1~~TRINITY_DN2528_c0_g1_i13.p1  ORF type:complete len:543 (-),score=100.13 TRINITY_DN2528_c0_g1_i13:117-1745(-)